MLCDGRHGMLVGWGHYVVLSTGGCLMLLLLALALQRQHVADDPTLARVLSAPTAHLQCLGQQQAAEGRGGQAAALAGGPLARRRSTAMAATATLVARTSLSADLLPWLAPAVAPSSSTLACTARPGAMTWLSKPAWCFW